MAHPKGYSPSLVHGHIRQCQGCYSRKCRSGLCFGFILLQASISTSTLSWYCGKLNDCKVGSILLSFLFEISMTNSDSLFDLMAAGLLPTSWMKLFSIAHGLDFLFISRSILHLKCVGYDWGFDLGEMPYHGSDLVLVYCGIWWLSGDIDITWMLQVESKKNCCSVRVPWLDETRFDCVFYEWVRFF